VLPALLDSQPLDSMRIPVSMSVWVSGRRS
jgi:hypothetical protein